jgi:hypothetical protein
MTKRKQAFDYASLNTDELSLMIGGFLEGAKSKVVLFKPGALLIPTPRFRIAYKSLVEKGLITETNVTDGVINLIGTPGHITGLKACIKGNTMQWLEEHAAWEMFASSNPKFIVLRNNQTNKQPESETDNENL